MTKRIQPYLLRSAWLGKERGEEEEEEEKEEEEEEGYYKSSYIYIDTYVGSVIQFTDSRLATVCNRSTEILSFDVRHYNTIHCAFPIDSVVDMATFSV